MKLKNFMGTTVMACPLSSIIRTSCIVAALFGMLATFMWYVNSYDFMVDSLLVGGVCVFVNVEVHIKGYLVWKKGSFVHGVIDKMMLYGENNMLELFISVPSLLGEGTVTCKKKVADLCDFSVGDKVLLKRRGRNWLFYGYNRPEDTHLYFTN